MSRQYSIKLPFPPSINGYWRSYKGRQIISAKGREYRGKVIACIAKLGLLNHGIKEDLSVEMLLFPPDKRSRDIDNYTKATFDALTHSGFWIDDVQVQRMVIEKRGPIKGGCIELIITVHSPLKAVKRVA